MPRPKTLSLIMILLGIVGTPAGGKSTVAKYLAEKGACWINADLIAKDMLLRDEVKQELRDHFGEGVITEGQVNKPFLASKVFGNDSTSRTNLDFLESIVHPLTRMEITRRIEQAAHSGVQVALLDIPLLFESKWDVCCDQIWCIDSPIEQRIQRVKERGWDRDELQRREANQLPIEVKSRLSNLVVSNRSTLDELEKKIDRAWEMLVTIEPAENKASSDHCFPT